MLSERVVVVCSICDRLQVHSVYQTVFMVGSVCQILVVSSACARQSFWYVLYETVHVVCMFCVLS